MDGEWSQHKPQVDTLTWGCVAHFLVDVWHVGGRHSNNRLVGDHPNRMAQVTPFCTPRSASHGGGHFWGSAIATGDQHAYSWRLCFDLRFIMGRLLVP